MKPQHCTLTTTEGSIEYELIRSRHRRRTLEIHIRHEGIVEVHAPEAFSMAAIESFLRRKARWILQKLVMFQERQSILFSRSSQKEKECLYLGQHYPLKWTPADSRWGRITFDDKGWLVEVPVSLNLETADGYVHAFLEKWFRSRALSLLQARVGHFTSLMEDEPAAVRIRSPKSLWGSCHPVKKVLHFNWRILMAPAEVVDYLVVHEMSHLRVADHSARFWARVAAFCPDYKAHQQWLKQNGFQLRLPFGRRSC